MFEVILLLLNTKQGSDCALKVYISKEKPALCSRAGNWEISPADSNAKTEENKVKLL